MEPSSDDDVALVQQPPQNVDVVDLTQDDDVKVATAAREHAATAARGRFDARDHCAAIGYCKKCTREHRQPSCS